MHSPPFRNCRRCSTRVYRSQFTNGVAPIDQAFRCPWGRSASCSHWRERRAAWWRVSLQYRPEGHTCIHAGGHDDGAVVGEEFTRKGAPEERDEGLPRDTRVRKEVSDPDRVRRLHGVCRHLGQPRGRGDAGHPARTPHAPIDRAIVCCGSRMDDPAERTMEDGLNDRRLRGTRSVAGSRGRSCPASAEASP